MEKLTEMELTSVGTRPAERALIGNSQTNDQNGVASSSQLPEESEYVETRYGRVFVTIQGDRTKTPIVTYPDIGLDSVTQFHGFFNFVENEPLMKHFCVYNLNAIGQEDQAQTLPVNYSYPTCDQLAETVLDVVSHYKLKQVICFGVGFGANILARFALVHPGLVNGCVLMNACSTKVGWIEWAYQKWNRWYLQSGQYTEFTNNYLLWHHFGYRTRDKHHDLCETYSRIFGRLNPINLSHLITAYLQRTDWGIERTEETGGGPAATTKKFNFKCGVLNVMGDLSPHDDDVVETNGRLEPATASLLKLADCGGMVLEEQPSRMAEAFRHFLQGLGYVPLLSVTHHSIAFRNNNVAISQKETLKKQNDNSNNGSATYDVNQFESLSSSHQRANKQAEELLG